MENGSIEKSVLQLREIEKLSARQIATTLGVGRRRVARILLGVQAPEIVKPRQLEPYRQLIAHWYHQYPRLKALQIYERLKDYGSKASYRSVILFTREYRRPKPAVYHTLDFLPGEEAQVDWFFFRHPTLGMLAGFLYVLSFSRYAWGTFYPRTTFEFFIAGHLECFEHLGGLARRHRYDNLKSVVLQRDHSKIEYNPHFLDFSTFFGFSIHLCNPYSGNEKGRVERLVRDARSFLYGKDFKSLIDLNQQFHGWFATRNRTVHRSTQKTPLELLARERLLLAPKQPYPARRVVPAVLVSKTAWAEFDTNFYSVPSAVGGKLVEIIAYPEIVEIWYGSKKVAQHKRSFERNERIQNPLHAERILQHTPHFKYERIRQILERTDPALEKFIQAQSSQDEGIQVAYEIFGLMKTHSRGMVISMIRELNQMGTFKIRALHSLLNLPTPKQPNPVWPQNTKLLNLQCQPRDLKNYDPAP